MTRALVFALVAGASIGCKAKPKLESDAATLAAIFGSDDAGSAPTTDDASAAAADPATSSGDDLPPLKALTKPTPGVAPAATGKTGAPNATGAKTGATAATAPTGGPANTGAAPAADPVACVVARALCAKGRPECDGKTAECKAAGGHL